LLSINPNLGELKNKIYILVGNLRDAKLLMLLNELAEQRTIIDGILVEKPNLNVFDKILMRMNRPLRMLKTKLIKAVLNQVPLETIQSSWGVKNLNSWNLLSTTASMSQLLNGINIVTSFVVSASSIAGLRNESGEVLVAVYAGGFFTEAILELERVHLLNAHMGRMPSYRGMAAIEWAVLNDEVPYVSVMKVAKAIDGGGVLAEFPIDISAVSSIAELRKKGYEACIKEMANCLILNKNKSPEFIPQISAGKYHYRMHSKIINEVELKIQSITNNS